MLLRLHQPLAVKQERWQLTECVAADRQFANCAKSAPPSQSVSLRQCVCCKQRLGAPTLCPSAPSHLQTPPNVPEVGKGGVHAGVRRGNIKSGSGNLQVRRSTAQHCGNSSATEAACTGRSLALSQGQVRNCRGTKRHFLRDQLLDRMSLAAASRLEDDAASLNTQGSHVWHMCSSQLFPFLQRSDALCLHRSLPVFPCGPAAVTQILSLCRPHRLCISAHSGFRKSPQTGFKHILASSQRGNSEPATFTCGSG